MASFYAELQLEGRAYPVRLAEFSIHQDVDSRGRPSSKKRQGPLRLTMDVPDNDDTLEHWAAAAYKPLAGQVVFYNLAAQVPHETIAFAAGQCVRYWEEFDDGSVTEAAYICRLTITAPAFELLAGGPAAPAAARRWAERAAETPSPGLSNYLTDVVQSRTNSIN